MKILSNHPTEILILLFLIVTFMQSGIDKITDWKGNIGFIKSHFKDSPLRNNVPMLLAIILTIEIAAGILMIIGTYQIYCIWSQRNCINRSRTFCCCLNFLTYWPTFGKRLYRSDDASSLFYHYPFWSFSNVIIKTDAINKTHRKT